MNYRERLHEKIIGRTTFPLSNYLFNRKKIVSNFYALKKSEHYPDELMRELQSTRLKEIIAYADRYIPYYTKLFKGIGLRPGDIKRVEDIKGIPPLGRQDVIDYHKDMVDVRMQSSVPFADNSQKDPGSPIAFAPFRRHKLIRNTSSGSTGAPTVFYDDGSRSALNWVHELRLKSWYGVRPGAKEARMTRLSVDYMPKSRVVQLRWMLWHQLILPGVNLADEHYAICLKNILKFKPQVFWGFTSALSGLAEYVNRCGGFPGGYRPKVVVGWAAPVYDHEEKIMKEAFQCAVANIYGAREVGHIAGKCPSGSFHINQENLIVEAEPVSGASEREGVREILVTTIDPSPMPFIRYRMGDVGEITRSDCACGRTLQVLTNFLGRTGEVFQSKEGRMISPNFWCRTFMSGKVSGAIRRFQVVYTKSRDLRIKVERDTGYTEETEEYLRDTIARNFSSETKLEVEYVSKIHPEISGKYQMVVNEAKE